MLKTNKSPGYDNIHVNVINNLYNEVKAPLMNICNLSLNTGIIPDRMNVAKVTPILKKKNVAFQIIDQYLFFLAFQKSWNDCMIILP